MSSTEELGLRTLHKILDDGLDELAARTHEGFALRMLVTFVTIGLASTMLPTWLCVAWLCVQTLSESISWLATRPQFFGIEAGPRRRAVQLATLGFGCSVWTVLGGLLWSVGTPEGAVSGVLIWLSVIMFTQTNAYHSPAGFVIGGALPGLGMLGFAVLGPNPLGLPLMPIGGLFVLALAFATDGSMRALSARQKLNEAQTRLAASLTEYRVLADNITDVIAVHELEGRNVYASPSVFGMMGYLPEEFLASSHDEYLHPEDKVWVLSETRSIAFGGAEKVLQYRVLRKDRSVVWVETTFGRIPAVGPNAPGRILSVSRNIDGRKAMESELVGARERAEAADAAKSDFLANMTHELRTPLNAIIGFSGLLRTSADLIERDARHVGLIDDASKFLLELVNTVLDFSRLEAGGVELEARTFDPVELPRAIVALLAQTATEKGLSLDLKTQGEISPLSGDPARLRQVLLNFTSNALKFTEHGGVTILVRRDPAGDARDRLRVEVTDTGIGIPQAQIETLFERFTQADASINREYGGTGLGLAICKRTVDLMEGKIGATSSPGQGSTFWFEVELPRAAAEALEVRGADSIEPDRPLRLLLVEDVAVNRELVTALLAPFDVVIETAENGAQAVDAMVAGSFDLVLMDVQMPVMDGLSATRAIRALPDAAGRHTPIVAMTANILPEQIGKCLAAGMDDHIGKPISPAELLGALSRWSRGREQGLSEQNSIAG